MPHVTFIHGLSNKPEANYLLSVWKRKLAFNDGIDLTTEGVTSTMVYWADVMYASPDTNLASYEAASGGEQSLRELEGGTPIEASTLNDEQAARLKRLAEKLGVELVPEKSEPLADDVKRDVVLERIPLPAFLKNKLMGQLLGDLHYYFFNRTSTPRPGESYQVGDELKKRFLNALRAVKDADRPHVVVSHSMGTIIAYDCLKHITDCPPIDGFMTIGSPLGLDEVQDFFPMWTRTDGFPSEKLKGRWVNVYDSYDPVAGFDPKFANDYQRAGKDVVEDVNEQNWGTWRHNISNYLQGKLLRKALKEMLGIA